MNKAWWLALQLIYCTICSFLIIQHNAMFYHGTMISAPWWSYPVLMFVMFAGFILIHLSTATNEEQYGQLSNR